MPIQHFQALRWCLAYRSKHSAPATLRHPLPETRFVVWGLQTLALRAHWQLRLRYRVVVVTCFAKAAQKPVRHQNSMARRFLRRPLRAVRAVRGPQRAVDHAALQTASDALDDSRAFRRFDFGSDFERDLTLAFADLTLGQKQQRRL